MKLVKIRVKGNSNKFVDERPNSLLFIDYDVNDLGYCYHWLKDSKYARDDVMFYFDEVEFLEEKEI